MLFSNFLYFSTNISPTSNVFIVINKFMFELQYFSALVQICLPLFKFKYFHLNLYIFMFFFTKLHLNSNIFIQIPIFLIYFKYYWALK